MESHGFSSTTESNDQQENETLHEIDFKWGVKIPMRDGVGLNATRLRLLISSPNSIYYQKNYNSGGVVTDESKSDARAVQVKLCNSPVYSSFLETPVFRAKKG